MSAQIRTVDVFRVAVEAVREIAVSRGVAYVWLVMGRTYPDAFEFLEAHADHGEPTVILEFGVIASHRKLRALRNGCIAQYPRRTTMSFLISAIALAGLRCLGQLTAQFMMVWQRYRRNESSS